MVRKFNFARIFPIFLSFFTVSCTGIFYWPRVQKTKFIDPSVVHLKEENVELETSLGIRIHAWYFAAQTEKSKGTVIFFHGNAENLTSHFVSLSWMPAEGYNYLIWDYPGYGVSEGEPSPKDNVVAAVAVMNWVHENKDPRPLIIFGGSLGGAVALRAVLEEKDRVPIRNLILYGTFRSYRSLARAKASQSWVTWLLQPVAWLIMSDAWAGLDVDQISPIPILVMHGQQDNVVPPEFGEDLYAAAKEPKEIWRVEGGGHNDAFFREKDNYRKRLLDYLAKWEKP